MPIRVARFLLARFFPIAYFFSWLASRFRRYQRANASASDLVVVLPDRARDWILERLCKEITAAIGASFEYHSSLIRLPAGKAYFFPHYSLFVHALKLNPALWRARTYVFYTHPSDIGVHPHDLLFALNHCTRVITMNRRFRSTLISDGVAEERIQSVFGAGYDPYRFRPHSRGKGAVGFCSAFYERKNPELIYGLVRTMPHRQFILLGKGWDQFDRFGELCSLANFEYLEASYDEYPAIYAKMDVFVSASKLEGGPIPLLEAMASNAVPVASDTGFASELIEHGRNGYLFDVDAKVEHVAGLVEKAFSNSENVNATVSEYTWERYASEMLSIMGLPKRVESR